MKNFIRLSCKLIIVLSTCIALIVFISGCNGPSKSKVKPNIVFFLVDDMGWVDCGINGSEYYETPNMDALAERGMLFTNAYAAHPLCSPTRASLLSGKYPARHGTISASGHRPPQPPGHNFMAAEAPSDQKMILPESKNFLDTAEYTFAEALHDAGYRTAHLGKWHLGLTPDYWPDKQGFDVVFHCAPDPGPPSYFSPYGVSLSGEPAGGHKVGSITDGPEGEYIMDRLADEAENFIEESKNGPFLLHLWSYGVHGPWGHKEEYTIRYADKKDPRGQQSNPIMASMLQSVDECLGRIVAKLEDEGLTENTIIIFTSDNGGNVTSNLPGSSVTRMLEERGDPMIIDWHKWAGNLAPTNNYPLRGGKNMSYEGGVRVPFITVWPGEVKPGSRSNEVVSSIDFYLTILGMANVQPREGQVIDGLSLLPVLKGDEKLDREALFCIQPLWGQSGAPNVSVRAGDWKLIRRFETDDRYPEVFQLYDLSNDIGESRNMADEYPERVKELDSLIDEFLKETRALVPKPNPAYEPAG